MEPRDAIGFMHSPDATQRAEARAWLRSADPAAVVIENSFWHDSESMSFDDGIILALLPTNGGAESVLLVRNTSIEIFLAFSSVLHFEEIDWPTGASRHHLTDDPTLIKALRNAVEGWAARAACADVGLRVGGFLVSSGRRTSLPTTFAGDDLERCLADIRRIVLPSIRHQHLYEHFQELGQLGDEELTLVATDLPLRAFAALGRCAPVNWPALQEAIDAHEPAAIDVTWLRFACPSAARRFVELCDGRSLPLVYLGHLDSHPDLGPLYTIHDGWEELLALLPVQPEPMRRIGYWAARGEERQYPNPASLVDQSADQDRQQAIADLLDDGMHCRAFFGLSPCRLCDDDRNGSTELTDGRYIWPSGLSHYVRDHDVVLPTEVTDALRPCTSIESGRWLIPQIVESMPTSDQRWRELTMPPSL